jgi:putative membrane protein
LGFVISLLLVFRTNTAYDRWWEGRKLWGSVVNDSRNLSSLLSSLDINTSERTYYTELIIAFSKSMKEHLRRNKLDLPIPLDESASVSNQPLWIAHELRKALHELRATDRIDSIQWQQLSRHLDQLIDSLGACERILNTPIPFSYSLFFKKFIFIYVVTMPLAFVELFEYWSVLISTFVFYALVSMEILAEEIEDPFGMDDNDLPLDDICERIEEGTKQMLIGS